MTLSARKPKPKRCRNTACRAEFHPARPLQAACSIACALVVAKAKQSREQRQAAKLERAQLKEAKEKLKRRSDYVKEAETAVRDYRRLYELSIGSPCISCGKSQDQIRAEQGWKTGGAFDGGHLLGKGARPNLRMIPDNIWLQCKACNAGSAKYARKGASVSEQFRANVIKRIGLDRVEELESDHEPRHYTIPDLQAIKAEYRAKVRELKKEMEA